MEAVDSVVFLRDGKYLVLGLRDEIIKIWDVATGDEVRTLEGHIHWVDSIVFSRDSKYLISGSEDEIIKI